MITAKQYTEKVVELSEKHLGIRYSGWSTMNRHEKAAAKEMVEWINKECKRKGNSGDGSKSIHKKN